MHPEFRNISKFALNGIVFFHAHKFWLNLLASWNILIISVTELTSHLEMSWLNAVPFSIALMSVTELTSHFEISWLKLSA